MPSTLPLLISTICVISALVIALIPLNWFSVKVTFYYQLWSMPVEYDFENGTNVNIPVSGSDIERGRVERTFTITGSKLTKTGMTAAFTTFSILSEELTVNKESMAIEEWIAPSKQFLKTKFIYNVDVNFFKDSLHIAKLFQNRDAISPRGPGILDFRSISSMFCGDGNYTITYFGAVKYSIDTGIEDKEGDMDRELGNLQLTVENATITRLMHSFNVITMPFQLTLYNPDIIRIKNTAIPILLITTLISQIPACLNCIKRRKNGDASAEVTLRKAIL